METEQKCNLIYPQAQQANIPVLDEFSGKYNFQMKLNNQGPGKHCVYSEMLQKIFINMEQTLSLRFEWEPFVEGLWLRSSMVFSQDQNRSDPVKRCHNHMASTTAANAVHPEIVKHVVRCLHPGSIYEDQGSHLSVITPLGMPQAGSDYVPMNFQFYCKNSCASSMNRRATELVFTLETHSGEILGRRRLPVRVCSCPKRDKEKEESENRLGLVRVPKKRKISAPVGKKAIISGNIDTREYGVQFVIPGKENYQAVMKYAYDLLAGQGIRTGQIDYLRPYLEDLQHKMQ
ncbi:cellular tumor antigen p53 isoform X2 [Venturia canescens]|nr:cellular tumor antigen p53 isoform X2 [Venturia canescens]